MKKKFVLILLLYGLNAVTNPKYLAAQSSVSFQLFYDELSPYGQWINYPSYGYVWVPDVENGFSPYSTNGYWIYTNEGWAWVSNYSWGWAPFHYGRWNYDDSFGWIWVPDNEWGPAWVTWRHSNNYYGWAPMGFGITINSSFESSHNIPHNHWNFVHRRDLTRINIRNYYVNQSTNITIINHSKVIKNIYLDNRNNSKLISGPKRDEVQKNNRSKIQTFKVYDDNKPGQSVKNGNYQIYRPVVKANNDDGKISAPTKLNKPEEIRHVGKPNNGIKNNNQNQNVPREKEINQEKRNSKQQSLPNKSIRNNQPNRKPILNQKNEPNKLREQFIEKNNSSEKDKSKLYDQMNMQKNNEENNSRNNQKLNPVNKGIQPKRPQNNPNKNPKHEK